MHLLPLLISDIPDAIGNFDLSLLEQLVDFLLAVVTLTHVKLVVGEHVLVLGDFESVSFLEFLVLLGLIDALIRHILFKEGQSVGQFFVLDLCGGEIVAHGEKALLVGFVFDGLHYKEGTSSSIFSLRRLYCSSLSR